MRHQKAYAAGVGTYSPFEWSSRGPQIRYERKRTTSRDTPTPGSKIGGAKLFRFVKKTDLDGDLASLRLLGPNWDDEGSEPPSIKAIETLERALGRLFAAGADPEAIRPSVDGGAAICFASDTGYGHIEFLNDGGIYCIAYGVKRGPENWRVADFEKELITAWNRITSYL